MKSSRQYTPLFPLLALSLIVPAAQSFAAGVDMNDPRRAARREDDIRIDAQLVHDTVGSGSPVAAKYQIENLTDAPIAVADKVADVSYDPETLTVTLTLGAEIPNGASLPKLVTIAPGEKKTLSGGGSLRVNVAARGPFTTAPRYVQIRVSILRDISAFRDALQRQARNESVRITDELFGRWLDANDSISLNAIPVRWTGEDPRHMGAEVSGAAMHRQTSPGW